MTTGTCSICGCTDRASCAAGCAWVDEACTLCSQCDRAIAIAKLFADVPPLWGDRPFADRQARVMITRNILDNLTRVLEEALVEEEAAASAELTRLALALRERYPDQVDRAIETETSIVDIVLTLLGDKRIVLAAG